MRPTTCPRHSPLLDTVGSQRGPTEVLYMRWWRRVLSTSDTSSRICALAVGSRYGAVATEQMRMDVVCRSVDGTVRHGVEVVQAGCTAVRASTLQHDRPHSLNAGWLRGRMNVWRVGEAGRWCFCPVRIGRGPRSGAPLTHPLAHQRVPPRYAHVLHAARAHPGTLAVLQTLKTRTPWVLDTAWPSAVHGLLLPISRGLRPLWRGLLGLIAMTTSSGACGRATER
jgi:hypothetical protein